MLVVLSLVLLPQTAQAAIDSKIKTSLDADKPPFNAAISLDVKTRVADLTGADPATRSAAREGLIIEVNAPGDTSYSSAFLDTYTKALNEQLLPLLKSNDVAIRLNAAIVVARAPTQRVDNTYLLPITEELLNDKSDAVVDWGLQAAGYVLAPLLQIGLPADQAKLIAAIKSHANNPQMLPLVYEALSLNYGSLKTTPATLQKMFGAAVPEALSVLQSRLQIYRKQVPPEPAGDARVALFFSYPTVWQNINPAVQLQVIQALSDLISVAGQRVASASGTSRDQLALVIRTATQALAAISLKVQPVYDGLQSLTKADPNDPALIQ